MDTDSVDQLKRQIMRGQMVTSEDVEKILHKCEETSITPRTTLVFYLTRCDADKFREAELINFMLDQLLTYCLPREEYQDIKPEDVRRLYEAARDTFLKSEKTGEAGELLLYILLESRGIIQLYSKMDLKTSKEMPFHGFDAMHIQVGNNVVFHFGHAKTHASLSSGLSEAVDDVDRFNKDSIQKRREIRLVSKHLDDIKFGDEAAEKIRHLLTPYSRDKESYSECNSILLGSEWPFTKESPPAAGTTRDNFMVKRYREEVPATIEKIKIAIDGKTGIADMNFLFLLLPITSVAEFRTNFIKELGPKA